MTPLTDPVCGLCGYCGSFLEALHARKSSFSLKLYFLLWPWAKTKPAKPAIPAAGILSSACAMRGKIGRLEYPDIKREIRTRFYQSSLPQNSN
jgi:hypothetical protein